MTAFYATGATYFVIPEKTEELSEYLISQQWIRPGEAITGVSSAGEGNMNLSLRITTNRKSYILKQSRPWVEKYPQIPATTERNRTEAAYLKAVNDDFDLATASPTLLGHDPKNHILFLEDLGKIGDLTKTYAIDEGLTQRQGSDLLAYLSKLHQLEVKGFPDNLALRRLNHEHIFVFPFQRKKKTGFDLDTVLPGLEGAAKSIRSDKELLAAAKNCGRRYLKSGTSLIHGDYYPGSWLATDDRTYVIDAEFAFVGPPEFDIGVYRAHLYFCRAQPELFVQIDRVYQRPGGFNEGLCRQFCGLEIIRRLIGLAQLPLSADLEQRTQWLEIARQMVLSA